MKPEVDVVLKTGGRTLLTQIMPAIDDSHFAGSTYVLSMLMNFAAQEYERGADVRVTDNAEMRAIFRDAADHVGDATLKNELVNAAGGTDVSLVISALNRSNDVLKEMLIRLHEHVEQRSDEWAVICNGHILSHLLKTATRRRLSLG